MAIILPMVAILSVTSEWSQRTGLTTFTFVPDRGRVIAAKALCSIGIGVVSMLLAMPSAPSATCSARRSPASRCLGRLGRRLAADVLANVLGLLVGFMLGVLIRSSAGAIVGLLRLLLRAADALALLADLQAGFADLQPWVDFNYAQAALYDGARQPRVGPPRPRRPASGSCVPFAIGARAGAALRGEVDPTSVEEVGHDRRETTTAAGTERVAPSLRPMVS